MKKIIFLEGLPGVGKTTITKYISKLNKNINIVNEIENPDILNNVNSNQNIYITNDNIKLNKYNEGIIIIDRGPISTLSYNQTKQHINKEHNIKNVEEWFNSIKKIYQNRDVTVIYLKKHDPTYYIPYEDNKDPYGSIENQKLLETITLSNIEKYCSNYQIINYNQQEMEELVNEIIN